MPPQFGQEKVGSSWDEHDALAMGMSKAITHKSADVAVTRRVGMVLWTVRIQFTIVPITN